MDSKTFRRRPVHSPNCARSNEECGLSTMTKNPELFVHSRRTQAAKQLDDPSLQTFTRAPATNTDPARTVRPTTKQPGSRTKPEKPQYDPTKTVCPATKHFDGQTMPVHTPGKTSPRPKHHSLPSNLTALLSGTIQNTFPACRGSTDV